MRVKRGQIKNKKHKAVLKKAKGYRMSYSRLYRRAKQLLLHSGAYSFAHRKRRRSQKREEWIKTISAALVGTGVTYSKFINNLKQNKVEIDRKNLAEMVINNPTHFQTVVTTVSK